MASNKKISKQKRGQRDAKKKAERARKTRRRLRKLDENNRRIVA